MAATRHRRRAGSPARSRRGTPGWLLLVAGLLIGAAVVTGWSWVRAKLAAPAEPAVEQPAAPPKPPPRPAERPPEKRFEFYDMLPDFEVVIPEEDREVRADRTPAPVEVPGVYVLQAGSYSTYAEADRMKAQLALLGIGSQIQKISVDERQYHRVRIGPIEQLDELNRVRQRLRNARIDVLVIRVGE
ncbi:MAG: SPOR domain-containing protein [Gammaproteobacteria bacterium]|nr:SPOR domain-containing protein [Gammaproteobacteria bacterium]